MVKKVIADHMKPLLVADAGEKTAILDKVKIIDDWWLAISP